MLGLVFLLNFCQYFFNIDYSKGKYKPFVENGSAGVFADFNGNYTFVGLLRWGGFVSRNKKI